MRLGVVGLGVVGRAVVKAADEGKVPVEVPVASELVPANVGAFLKSLSKPPRLTDLAGVVEGSDVVLEAAGAAAVEPTCRAALAKGKDVIIMSIGALLEREDLVELARRSGARIFAPSGAMIGLDGLKGAAMGRVDSVTMTTRKPPAGLKGAPFIEKNKIDLDAIREPTVIFEGSPIEAIRGFPANVNVCASVSLAGVGPRRTKMRVVCDPTVDKNIHEVEAVGEFGRSLVRIENVPSENKRTSILTFLSIMSFLRERDSALVIGT